MEEPQNGYWLNDAQYSGLNAAWDLLTFVEGAVSPKLEINDSDSTPFTYGLYRTIQKIKKQFDLAFAYGEDKETPRSYARS